MGGACGARGGALVASWGGLVGGAGGLRPILSACLYSNILVFSAICAIITVNGGLPSGRGRGAPTAGRLPGGWLALGVCHVGFFLFRFSLFLGAGAV